MSLTAGALSQVSVTDTTASLSSAVATSGTAPYTYQWYRSTTSGFSPGGGNIISGATSLTLDDTGLIPNTLYYYKVVVTDAVSATDTATQLAVTTAAPALSPNQFAMSSYLGVLDQKFNTDTTAVQIDATQATALYAGGAVKLVDSAGGVPKVVGCAAESDEVFGFLNFNFKNVSYVAGQDAEVSMASNVMYLYATAAIARGAEVSLDLSTNGGVHTAAGNTGDTIVGWAFDKATAAGDLIRVYIKTPSFTVV